MHNLDYSLAVIKQTIRWHAYVFTFGLIQILRFFFHSCVPSKLQANCFPSLSPRVLNSSYNTVYSNTKDVCTLIYFLIKCYHFKKIIKKLERAFVWKRAI